MRPIETINQLITRTFAERVGNAALEVFCVGVMGVLPLFAISFFDLNEQPLNLSGYWLRLQHLIGLGQLFLYSFSLIGSLFYLIFARINNAHVFARVVLGLSTLLVGLVSFGIFLENPSMSRPMNQLLICVSIICFALCLIIYFFLLMCESVAPKTPSIVFRNDINQLVSNAEARAQ